MSDDNSRIENLKKLLYSKKGSDILHKKVHLEPHEVDVPQEWRGSGELDKTDTVIKQEIFEEDSSSFFKKIFWAAVVFFIIALGFALYVIYGNKNVISANNINILVAGPVSVAGGEPISLDVKIENDNNVKLELVDLSIQFPPGTSNATDLTQSLPRYRELVGDIEPHQSAIKKVNLALFGEESTKKTLHIVAEYRVAGSNAVFSREKDYDIFITSAPVSMTVSSLREVNANQNATFTVVISSNSSQTIKNLLVKAEYPFGFTFASSDPRPNADVNTWYIDTLTPGAKKMITLTGKIQGQNEEDRVFKFNLGLRNPRDEKNIGTQLAAVSYPVLVKKPFVSAVLALDGDANEQDHIGQLNNTVNGTITWTNNTTGDVIDGVIVLKFTGTVLDKETVTADTGFYRSADNTITWDKTNTDALARAHPGEGGQIHFSFTPKIPSFVSSSGVKNPEVDLDISVQAKRVSEGNVPEQILSTVTRKVKIAPNLGFSSRIVRSTGPFTNSGPFPPKVEKESTYTVIWTVTDTSSNISGAVVKAILPSYVKWLGKTSPQTEPVTYDPVSGEIKWSPGEITAGAGYTNPAREVSFQVAFTPSANQVGSVPTLVGEAKLTGQDRFTGANLENTKPALTTKLATDPAFANGDEDVVQ